MNKGLNTHTILTAAGYGGCAEYPRIAKRATELARLGFDEDALLAKIRGEFGTQQNQTMQEQPAHFAIFGNPGVDIEWGAIEQMRTAMRLPVAVAGAIMPDAHVGYGLPIGGVIKLHEAVSPAFVGYDIACRVAVSVLDCSVDDFMANRGDFVKIMQSVSRFGVGAAFEGDQRRDHPVMDDPLWEHVKCLQGWKDLAWDQLGSSGAGNHFFDALIGQWSPLPGLLGSRFTAIMTHSGSRGVGYKVAEHYSEIAERETRLVATGIPKGYGWLSTNSDVGREYLAVMGLMGRYAQANHYLIHHHFLTVAGIDRLMYLENHHNYAWVQPDGDVIHRKGATPAGNGEMGIIPGSSGTKSYIARGLGNADSLESSSHGAGRRFSRSVAKQKHNATEFAEWMTGHDILHIGVAADETLAAYKDIDEVMALQKELVVPIAEMSPVAVIMGGAR
jgi:tRNA-splicing ligase RtcB